MKRKFVFFLFWVSLVVPTLASAFLMLQLTLPQMTALSEKVFIGKCLSIKKSQDRDGQPIQWVTFAVEEMLKGEPADQITFKQLGNSSSQDNVILAGEHVHVPRYVEGEEAIIFLSEEGNNHFTAPVGLYQGKFQVTTSKTGEKLVLNGMNNQGLFVGWNKNQKLKGMTLSAAENKLMRAKEGGLPLEGFATLVKKLATAE